MGVPWVRQLFDTLLCGECSFELLLHKNLHIAGIVGGDERGAVVGGVTGKIIDDGPGLAVSAGEREEIKLGIDGALGRIHVSFAGLELPAVPRVAVLDYAAAFGHAFRLALRSTKRAGHQVLRSPGYGLGDGRDQLVRVAAPQRT